MLLKDNPLYTMGIRIGMYKENKYCNNPHIHIEYEDCHFVYDLIKQEIVYGDNCRKSMKNVLFQWINDNTDKLLELWNEIDPE